MWLLGRGRGMSCMRVILGCKLIVISMREDCEEEVIEILIIRDIKFQVWRSSQTFKMQNRTQLLTTAVQSPLSYVSKTPPATPKHLRGRQWRTVTGLGSISVWNCNEYAMRPSWLQDSKWRNTSYTLQIHNQSCFLQRSVHSLHKWDDSSRWSRPEIHANVFIFIKYTCMLISRLDINISRWFKSLAYSFSGSITIQPMEVTSHMFLSVYANKHINVN